MQENKKIVLWFRNDLRLHDNEALTEAVQTGAEIYPVFVFDERWFQSSSPYGFKRVGDLRRRFILECIHELKKGLKALGLSLIIREGKSEEQVFDIARKVQSKCVLCNRERTREEVLIQEALECKLWSIGQELRYFRGKMLLHTADLPFPVTHVPDNFTNFKKEVEQFVSIRTPFQVPDAGEVVAPSMCLESLEISELEDGAIHNIRGGEIEALNRLHLLAVNDLQESVDQNFFEPHLSPYIAQGALSAKMVYHFLKEKYDRKLRDFFKLKIIQDLFLRDYFRLMGKKHGDLIFQKTGIIPNEEVDFSCSEEKINQLRTASTDDEFSNAILRQLQSRGFIPHFAREYLGRFIIKNMKLDWRIGAELFEEYLLDYDPCSNWVNWQFLAGQGPEGRRDQNAQLDYLRKKYDPHNDYFNRWGTTENITV